LSTEDEMRVYDEAPVSQVSGETESYDNAFFPYVIRKRELELIQEALAYKKPHFILDYGCGGGWLSLLLQEKGFSTVGIDVSRGMVRNAKIVCHNSEFLVCDAMRLPFRDGIFDFVIGISILHHLDIKKATVELKRVSGENASFLFMEPSLINPLSAFGRKMFPMEAHTEGEKPYLPSHLKIELNRVGFKIDYYITTFFFAFPLARASKLLGLRPPMFIVKFSYFLEKAAEKLPFIKGLNSNIIAILAKR
jgi:SAM-dependent methyltransferase